MKKIEKILKHIETQGLSVSEFERNAGLSNGYLTNTAKRGADVTDKILEKIKINLRQEYSKIFDGSNNIEESQKGLEKNNPALTPDFMQKYVEQLEKNNAILEKNLEQMEQRLKAVDEAFKQIEIMKAYLNRFETNQRDIVANLNEISETQFLFGAVQQGWQEYWSEHLKGAPKVPLHEVKEMIRTKVASLLHLYSDKGKEAVLNQDN